MSRATDALSDLEKWRISAGLPPMAVANARRLRASQAISRWVTVYWGTARTTAILRGYTATAAISPQMVSRWVLQRTLMQSRYVDAILRVAPFIERRRAKEDV